MLTSKQVSLLYPGWKKNQSKLKKGADDSLCEGLNNTTVRIFDYFVISPQLRRDLIIQIRYTYLDAGHWLLNSCSQ